MGVGSDSMATLGALEKGRSKSPPMNMIMRELSLDEALSSSGYCFRLRHIAGVDNKLADALSRLDEPGSGATVPYELRELKRREAPPRGAAWWRAGGRAEAALAAEEADEAQSEPAAAGA